jgi:hypothetical protein
MKEFAKSGNIIVSGKVGEDLLNFYVQSIKDIQES